MRCTPAGHIVFLLNRKHIDSLRFGTGLHHRTDPVFLFFCSWPFEVLPPTARIGFANPARIILNTMQLRRVDTGKAENPVAVFQLRTITRDKVFEMRLFCGHGPSTSQHREHRYQ